MIIKVVAILMIFGSIMSTGITSEQSDDIEITEVSIEQYQCYSHEDTKTCSVRILHEKVLKDWNPVQMMYLS